MNSELTKPSSLQELYRTYFSFANKFEFTSLLRNYIQNEEWKDKSQEQIWDVISKISDDIGAVLTDDIVNYTRNIVDINTCKTPQLIEHALMLSYHLDNIKNSYQFFPKKIQCLVDIFSVNQEYLIGNGKNHILSDEVIKEILVYIRENSEKGQSNSNSQLIDTLIDDPHGITDENTYKEFITQLFYQSLIDALTSCYSEEDGQPMVFNLLWKENEDQGSIIGELGEYKSWLDKYILNQIDHPLNDQGLSGTIYDTVQLIKNQKQISPKFNPFAIADHIYFNGMNPTNSLSSDELDLVEMVLNYHAKTKYDYKKQMFVESNQQESLGSTRYAYYKELEFCEYLKFVMFTWNNLVSFNASELTYDVVQNKFSQTSFAEDKNCLRVVEIFHDISENTIVKKSDGTVAIDTNILKKVAQFLCKYVFLIQQIRENIKTIAQKHAMRGSGALLVHIVNDYLIKQLPVIRDNLFSSSGLDDESTHKFGWEVDTNYKNYGNVKILEYEDNNEYFNIDPSADVRFTQSTNNRYWEQIESLGQDDSLGVLKKSDIQNFYKNTLGMGRLQVNKSSSYDDIADFLVDLFKIGANPISYDSDEKQFNNPIDDIINKSEEDYGYTKEERVEVQTNSDLRENQEKQFLAYSGNDDLIGEGIYDLVNSKIFYWKNTDYSSHVLHPFMYNLKLWNRLNNIIINGYRDYVNSDLVDYLSSKTKFDQLFGEFGESKNFWKYNILDWTGYTTRYEAAVKDEHLDDEKGTISELTGYDGLFYPTAAQEFLDLYSNAKDFIIPDDFFQSEGYEEINKSIDNGFIKAIHSIYWQIDDPTDSFYVRWYSHLNYTRSDYQKTALQLWYWRDRIYDFIANEYQIKKYCLDIQGNSLMLISPFKESDSESDQFLVDLTIAQSRIENPIVDSNESTGDYGNQNRNKRISTCDNKLVIPCELWIRWKSSPIAIPAFDIEYTNDTGDDCFDKHYRNGFNIEFGQIVHTNSSCNENFKLVIDSWKSKYGLFNYGNKFPVFFDMEQSANVIAFSSWYLTKLVQDDGVDSRDEFGNDFYVTNCAKNPYHIISTEVVGTGVFDYQYQEYSSNRIINETGKSNWLFDAYHYCPASGALLVPLYRFVCSDDGVVSQHLKVKLFVISAQQLKNDNFSALDKIVLLGGEDGIDIDLNSKCKLSDSETKYRFDYPIGVCNNTKLVFSVHSDNGNDKVKCAFLGQYLSGQEANSYKIGSCSSKTRYEFDSQDVSDLALLKGRFYQGNNINTIAEDAELSNQKESNSSLKRMYIDETISESAHNSYDRNDKYVFVIDFDSPIGNQTLFNMDAVSGMTTYSYNILGDAGYIPHFAYQSLVKYGDSDGGVAYTWKNNYFKDKDQMSFELLGLDDKNIAIIYDEMSKLVVQDLTDDCYTIFKPTKFIDDIYRVWCDTVGVKAKKKLSGDTWQTQEYNRLDQHIYNEYKDYPNPELKFESSGVVDWEVKPTVGEDGKIDYSELFELNLPEELQQLGLGVVHENESEEDRKKRELQETNAFRLLLDEYYVSIVRTDDYDILNEKRYILQPTQISKFFFGQSSSDSEHNEDFGFIDCNINPYQSASMEDNHFVSNQVVFAGTPNPFNYDKDGERIYSKAEELQYGNGIFGVGSLQMKIDIVGVESVEKVADGWDISEKTISRKYIKPTIRIKRFSTQNESNCDSELSANMQKSALGIEKGQITIILSHKNLDNIAKYHVLNRRSNLYYDGSLQKSNKNKFKHSDFKYGQTVRLEYNESTKTWKSLEPDFDTKQYLEFSLDQVKGYSADDVFSDMFWDERWPGFVDRPSIEDFPQLNGKCLPPYYLTIGSNSEEPTWYLEQEDIANDENNKIELVNHPNQASENTVERVIPSPGKFKWAHKIKARPEKYIDYLYVDNHGLAFKVNEESNSFSDTLDIVPPFYIDDRLRNKLGDLNDVQEMNDFSTFIHQSENPSVVKDCKSFNPYVSDVVLNLGLLDSGDNGVTLKQPDESEQEYLKNKDKRLLNRVIEVSSIDGTGTQIKHTNTALQLDNSSTPTSAQLQLEDGEIDQYLKIYTNYVCVDEADGGHHFDLYFNIQNLLNSPFEYISSITNQPNVLILKDSFLYLSGDKFTDGKIDEDKVNSIKQGGDLVIYGQIKSYSNDKLSSVDTVKLFAYKVYNISDDKPKFLIRKTYDITKSNIQNSPSNIVKIQFKDVLWTIDEDCFVSNPLENEKFNRLERELDSKIEMLNARLIALSKITPISSRWKESFESAIGRIKSEISIVEQERLNLFKKMNTRNKDTVLCKYGDQLICRTSDSDPNRNYIVCGDGTNKPGSENYRILGSDVEVIQPLSIMYNWDKNNNSRITSLSFDIENDKIDFRYTPELCGYYTHDRALKNHIKLDKPNSYYDRWSDRYMKLEWNEATGNYRITLTYDEDCGYNFETIYLRWRLPENCRIMDTIDRLGGKVFCSTAKNIQVLRNNDSSSTLNIQVESGEVQARVREIGKLYLGLEHSTTNRTHGYVLTGLKDMLANAISKTTISNKVTSTIKSQEKRHE